MKKLAVMLIAVASVAFGAPSANAAGGTIRIPEYASIAQTQYVLSGYRAQYPTYRLQVDMGTNETWPTRWQRCVTQYLGSGLLSSNQYVCNRAWGSP